jgi:acyl dehydratase
MQESTLKPITADELVAAAGTQIGCSPWREITQAVVDKFAEATDDHQFIHVDPERAAREAPFGGTIAHGFLLLSLLSRLAFEAVPPLEGVTVGINYGFDEVRFKAPVRTGSRVRGCFTVAHVNVRQSGWVEVNYDVTLEIEGSSRPALTARWLTLLQMPRRERAP